MIDHTLDTENSILYVRPTAALDKQDFVQLAATVDPYIEKSGGLAGLIIDAPKFPGWDSFGALASHIRFVQDHQKQIGKSHWLRIPSWVRWRSIWRRISWPPRSGILGPVISRPPGSGS